MKIIEFIMLEIIIFYKDNVKVFERVKIFLFEMFYFYLKLFYIECMEYYEESYVMFFNWVNKVLGVFFIFKGGMVEIVMDVKIIL